MAAAAGGGRRRRVRRRAAVRRTGPIAVLVARIYDTPDNPAMVPRRRLHVETLVVASKQRRHGIGRRLMAEAVAWGRGHGAVEMVLTTWVGNSEAEAFYERLGYRELSRVLTRARCDRRRDRGRAGWPGFDPAGPQQVEQRRQQQRIREDWPTRPSGPNSSVASWNAWLPWMTPLSASSWTP